MQVVDVSFPVQGNSLPLDHGYALYSAVSRVLGPASHGANGIGIHPIRGRRVEPDRLQLGEMSALCIRTQVDAIPELLKLAGQSVQVAGDMIRLGAPKTYALTPAATLGAHLVTIKGFREPELFLEAALRQMEFLGITGQARIPIRASGPHEGEPTRRVLRIKDKTVVGFALVVGALVAGDSLLLQQRGLGGRRHMGCGLFDPRDSNER